MGPTTKDKNRMEKLLRSDFLRLYYGNEYNIEVLAKFPIKSDGSIDSHVLEQIDKLWKSYKEKYIKKCKEKGLPVLV